MRPYFSILFSITLAFSQVPRIWDDAVMPTLELPLARPEYSPKHISAETYYKSPVRPIYKSYPVYHPDRAPAGYFEWLQQQEPQETFPKQTPTTEADWIRAGELVFNAPILSFPGAALGTRVPADTLYLRDKAWYNRVNPPLTRDGILPFYRYVVRKKGTVEVGILACAMCHTRVMPDGSTVKGAQGNFPFDRAMADDFRSAPSLTPIQRSILSLLYTRPWLPPQQFNPDLFDGRLPGSMTRHRSHPDSPIGIPDLIGLQNRRYLDRTGLQQNRGPEDIMRYAALNQGGDDRSSFGGFIPAGDPASGTRYSDEQLYALTKYLLSLKHPPNPNPVNSQTKKGQQIFQSAGCGGCPTPPLYSNNKLTPAEGFKIPADHRGKYDILPVVIGTDPGLAMETRRGTGYYKVPSLLGVWNRGALSHTGQVASLEEWLSPARLAKTKGHQFGLQLKPEDKAALIAFLRTL